MTDRNPAYAYGVELESTLGGWVLMAVGVDMWAAEDNFKKVYSTHAAIKSLGNGTARLVRLKKE